MKLVNAIRNIANSWSKDNISTLAAALAYYTLFSLTPILLISLNLVVLFFNEETVRNALLNHMKELFGQDTASQIGLMIEHSQKNMVGIRGQLFGWILLFIVSSALFSELQSSLNHIWGVKANFERKWFIIIKHRFLSFIMVLGVALILLISLILSLILTTMTTYINQFIHIGRLEIIIFHATSFFLIVLLFAMIFKILPDVIIKWRNVWLGSVITAFLFMLGKYILALYLSRVQVASMYGAAGSLVVLLIWMYYSTQIFFIGAVITKVIAFEKKESLELKRQAFIMTKHDDHP